MRPMSFVLAFVLFFTNFNPVAFLPQAQAGVCGEKTRQIFLPIVTAQGASMPSINEHLESLIRGSAAYPYDGRITQIFGNSVHVMPIGSRRILKDVGLPDHIKSGDLSIGMAVKLDLATDKPVVIAVLPQFNDPEMYNYAGIGSRVPATPTVTVQATKNGWVVSWNAVTGATKYILYKNDDDTGDSPEEVIQLSSSKRTYTVSYDDPFRWFAVRACAGYLEGDISLWATDQTSPSVPNTFDVEDDITGHRLLILGTDNSLKDSTFKYWEIEQADDASGTNGISLGQFGLTDFPKLITYPQGVIKYYRIRSLDFGDVASAWTAWQVGVALTGIIQDKFDGYGGGIFSPLESLYWLSISTCESTAGFKYPENLSSLRLVTSLNTTLHKEGQYGVKLEPQLSGGWPLFDAGETQYDLPGYPIDFTNEGRFTEDDYIVLSMYAARSGLTTKLYFFNDPEESDGFVSPTINLQLGHNFIAIKRGDFTIESTPADWTIIKSLNIYVTGFDLDSQTDNFVVVDDIRLVKADPDDATTYNDTGLSWDRAAHTGSDVGEWHIYPGNRTGEPSKPFSYGQIKTAVSPAVWYLSHKLLTTTNIATGTIQAGVYLKGANGKAGLSFFVKEMTPDQWTMYAIEADSAGNTVKLVKWVAGTRTEIASTAFAFNPNQILWLGADFRDYDSNGGRIKVYASLSEGNLIQASRMVISAQDTEWIGDTGGSVGVLSYQANARFINFVAGSPAHADVADVAHALDGPIVAGESRRVRANSDSYNFEYSDDGSTWKYWGGLIGELKMWVTNTAPAGWLLCYGQAISRATYATLFAVIGTTFGSGDGSTTFNLPDFRGRTPLGKDNMGGTSANRVTATQADNIGQGSGAETHTLTETEMPSHTHGIKYRRNIYQTGNVADAMTSVPGENAVTSDSAGGNNPHNNMPPYLTINYIIYTGV